MRAITIRAIAVTRYCRCYYAADIAAMRVVKIRYGGRAMAIYYYILLRESDGYMIFLVADSATL